MQPLTEDKYMDMKMKHLDIIQATITRMANNSFLIRGWAVTLISALMAFSAAKDANAQFLYIAFVVITMFWVLDTYFLRQERLYRLHYDNIRKLPANQIDFDMSPVLPTDPEELKKYLPVRVFLSKTLRIFYVPMVFLIVAATVFLDLIPWPTF